MVTRRVFVVCTALLLAVCGSACSKSGADCRSDSDCPDQQTCLNAGGVFFGKGQCVRACYSQSGASSCRQNGGICRNGYCVDESGDGGIVSADGGVDADTAPPPSPDGCTRPTNREFCREQGLPCDTVQAEDRCGDPRSVDCRTVIDFSTNVRHCGACGHTCQFQHAGGKCQGGRCQIVSCNDGWKDLDGQGDNGCECEVQTEECNGEDDDCDGTIDEGCDCTAGDTQNCYGGPPGTRDTGACQAGQQTCNANGDWGACQGEVTPGKEQCGDAEDNDCDGVTNEGCQCDYQSRSHGVCTGRTRTPSGDCPQPSRFESPEKTCDDQDNDCDGRVDEGCDSDGDGYCDASRNVDGSPGACPNSPAGQPKDCDDGDPAVHPNAGETCGNQVDENCNGQVDEGCDCNYMGNSKGVCGRATTDMSGNCQQPSAYESTESSCEDSVDNDCDGALDAGDGNCQVGNAGAKCSSDLDCISGSCDKNFTSQGACRHRVFVTSDDWSADFGGLSGADEKCMKAARAQGLGGRWKAILSDDSLDASSRLRVVSPVVNLNDEVVADDRADLWDQSIDTDIDYNEKSMSAHPLPDEVWTGSNATGHSAPDNCQNWTSTSPGDDGVTGDFGRNNSDWLEDPPSDACLRQARLYCIDGQ